MKGTKEPDLESRVSERRGTFHLLLLNAPGDMPCIFSRTKDETSGMVVVVGGAGRRLGAANLLLAQHYRRLGIEYAWWIARCLDSWSW